MNDNRTLDFTKLPTYELTYTVDGLLTCGKQSTYCVLHKLELQIR